MAIFQNLVARLIMDSTAFDRGARSSSASMKGMMAASLALQREVAGLVASYVAGKGLVSALSSVTRAAIEAESADRGMTAALRIAGKYSEQNAELLRLQADGMENLTVYSRNAIEEQQALALTMGASVPELSAMTEAAVGLAAAYKKDLSQTMRTVALARQGETGQLKEMGIVVDTAATKQKQYLQVLQTGKSNFQRATEDAETLKGAIAQLANEWEKTKEAIAKPLTPALTKGMQFLRQELKGGQGGQSAWYRTKALPQDQQDSLWTAYAQRTKERGVKDDFAYLSKLTAAYERSDMVQAKIKGGDGATAAAGTTAAQRAEIVKLNEQLKEQIEIQRELAGGNQHAAETVRYAAAAEEAYGNGTNRATGAMVKFHSAMEMLDDLRSRAAAAEYLQELKDEEEILRLRNAGMEDQAALQEVLNDFRRRGIELTEEETDAIAEQIDKISDLEDHYTSLSDGIRSAFSEIGDQMQTVGDLAHDVITEGIDGIADSIAKAVVYGDDLGESLKKVGQEIAAMVVKWAVMQAIGAVLPGAGASVGHSGGTIGVSGFSSRSGSAAGWAGAPRLHDGLKADEFRFIGQRGEKITSKSGVASENRLQGRMVSLLERIASRGNVTSVQIVDKRQTPQEWYESRAGEQAWQRHAARNQ
jgi:hypothetical protein